MDKTIVTLLSVFIGVFIALFGIILRAIYELRLDVRSIQKDIDNLRKNPIIPSSQLFFAAWAREAKFWGKLFIQRSDKIVISAKIASNYVQEGDEIIVDSGTTIDQIPHILRERLKRVRIHTNNLLAAISSVPTAEGFECILLPGRIDPIYGATYNIKNIEGPLKPITAQQIIIASTAITFDDGPMVKVKDISNLLFKKELVRKALVDPDNSRLIIAVDWTKFAMAADNNEFNPVLELKEWKAVRATKRFLLVTTKPSESLETSVALKARKEIDKFMRNMNRNDGITLHFAQLE